MDRVEEVSSSTREEESVELIEEVHRWRPLGITVLVVLLLLSGVIGIFGGLFLLMALGENPEAIGVFTDMGFPPVVLICVTWFFAGLAMAAGAGMLLGKDWGWYLGALVYAYGMVRHLSAMITIPLALRSWTPEQIDEMTWGPVFYMIKHGIGFTVQLLIFLYLFRINVREYFRLDQEKIWKLVLVPVVMCLVIVVGINVVVRIWPS